MNCHNVLHQIVDIFKWFSKIQITNFRNGFDSDLTTVRFTGKIHYSTTTLTDFTDVKLFETSAKHFSFNSNLNFQFLFFFIDAARFSFYIYHELDYSKICINDEWR